MTRILTAAVFSLAASFAFAASHNTALMAEIETYFAQQGVEYDAATLTDEQLAAIQNILSGDDGADAKKSAIMAILEQ